jgi:hypothetical protein
MCLGMYLSLLNPSHRIRMSLIRRARRVIRALLTCSIRRTSVVSLLLICPAVRSSIGSVRILGWHTVLQVHSISLGWIAGYLSRHPLLCVRCVLRTHIHSVSARRSPLTTWGRIAMGILRSLSTVSPEHEEIWTSQRQPSDNMPFVVRQTSHWRQSGSPGPMRPC